MHDTICIELCVTLKCNARCINCSRHCNLEDLGVDNSHLEMSVDAIKKFVNLVKARGGVDTVFILGGEPLVHPDIEFITGFIKHELLRPGFIKELRITSNGLIKRRHVAGVRVDVCLPYNKKSSNHRCSFVAPIDTKQRMSYPCRVPKECGMAYTADGIYPCGPGSVICRLFGLDEYKKNDIPNSLLDFGNLYNMCKFCQLSVSEENQTRELDHGRMISSSYKKRFDLKIKEVELNGAINKLNVI